MITPSIRPKYLHISQECLEGQTDQDFEWHVELGLRNRGFTLPSDWNKLLRRCVDGWVFMYQDCIEIPNDAIEKIRKIPLGKTAYTFPLGKYQKDGTIAYDWRINSEGRAIEPQEWEADLAIAPLQMFKDIGGFDEEYNKGWSWENVEVAYRAAAAGYDFACSHTIIGKAIDHDANEEHPFRMKREPNSLRANGTYHMAKLGEYKLDFL